MSNLEHSPLIVALDVTSKQEALAIAKQLKPKSCRLKVGKALFTSAGLGVIDELQQLGFEIFLDLKYHDIPQTVADACYGAANLGVWMINVHGLGGPTMLSAAREGIDKSQHQPLLIAVTLLTSMDATEFAQLGFQKPMEETVLKLATWAQEAGLDGAVCSAKEARMIKAQLGQDFKLVCPGIRFADGQNHDQKRIMTPDQALSAGVDYLVMGRAITQSPDPKAAVQKVIAISQRAEV